MVAAVRTVVRDIDPDLPLYGITTLREQVVGTIAEERQSAAILGAFSLMALLLSAVGLFGVLAKRSLLRSVRRRRPMRGRPPPYRASPRLGHNSGRDRTILPSN